MMSQVPVGLLDAVLYSPVPDVPDPENVQLWLPLLLIHVPTREEAETLPEPLAGSFSPAPHPDRDKMRLATRIAFIVEFKGFSVKGLNVTRLSNRAGSIRIDRAGHVATPQQRE